MQSHCTYLSHIGSHNVLSICLSLCSAHDLFPSVQLIAITIEILLTRTVTVTVTSTVGYKKEVNDWLNSTECVDVFQGLRSMLLTKIEENRNGLESTENDDVYVYLAADNEQVKEAFAATVLAEDPTRKGNFTINLMRMETKFVQHIKNLAHMKAATNNEGTHGIRIQYLNLSLSVLLWTFVAIREGQAVVLWVEHSLVVLLILTSSPSSSPLLSSLLCSCPAGLLDIVFDWYALTLANTVIAWRKGFTGHVSTFVHSAQRVSGTTERTIIGAPIGHG